MLEELFKAISKQAVQAQLKAPIAIPGDAFHVLAPEDTVKINLPLPRRAHKAADLTAVIAFAEANETASVFYDRAAVTCLVDDGDRRDRIALPLSLSPQLTAVMEWERCGQTGKVLGQKELILLLRTVFKRCLGRCPNLVDTLRKLRFDAGGTVTADVGKHKTSLSKEMLAKVSGEAELPDEFELVVPVFDGTLPQLTAQVTVAMEADGATAKFSLIPIPGDVETALCAAERAIGDILSEALSEKAAGQRLYYGVA